jgi:hypothetical protein
MKTPRGLTTESRANVRLKSKPGACHVDQGSQFAILVFTNTWRWLVICMDSRARLMDNVRSNR